MTGALGAIGGMANTAAEFLFGQVGMTHRFSVQIDSMQYDLGDWASASGLQVKWQQVEFRSGETNQVWTAPGNASYDSISLSRAACSDSQTVQQWLTTVSRNNKPLSGTIQMVDFMGMTVVEWKLKEFFPISWKIVGFEASGSKAAIETLDLAHSGFLDDEMKYGGA
jgi:phage tail-like protein